jgi:hypothetical protein
VEDNLVRVQYLLLTRRELNEMRDVVEESAEKK